jgi:hypothetical protein
LPRPTGEKPGEKRWEEQAREMRAWHELNGVPQTDRLFDNEIVDRMGAEFCRRILAPAVD